MLVRSGANGLEYCERQHRDESREMLPDFEDYLYFEVSTPPLGATMPKSTSEKRDFLIRVTKEWIRRSN
jgi:hypothetical protein